MRSGTRAGGMDMHAVAAVSMEELLGAGCGRRLNIDCTGEEVRGYSHGGFADELSTSFLTFAMLVSTLR